MKKIITVGMAATMLLAASSQPINVLATSRDNAPRAELVVKPIGDDAVQVRAASFATLMPDEQLRQAILEFATTKEGYLTTAQKETLATGNPAQIQAVLATIIRLNLNDEGLTFATLNGINQLRNLEYLNLRGNQLAAIGPQTFWGMNQLGFLYLDNTGLTKIDQDAFGDLPQLQALGLTQNPGLTNFDALFSLSATTPIAGGAFGGASVMLWQMVINKMASLGDVAALVPHDGSALNQAIQFAQFKEKLRELASMKVEMAALLEMEPMLGASATIKAALTELKNAVEVNDNARFVAAKAQLYAQIYDEVLDLSNTQIGHLGTNIRRDPGVVRVLAAFKAEVKTENYQRLTELLYQLDAAITAFVQTTRQQTTNAIKNAQSKKAHTTVKVLIANAQSALAGYNYDQMISCTQALNAAVKQIVAIKNSPLKIKRVYHLHKYVAGTANPGTQIVVKQAGKTTRLAKVGQRGTFKIKVGKLKKGQQITVTADAPDSPTTLFKLASKSVKVKQSPKPIVRQVRIKGKKVTGKVTKGATVKIYRGKKLVAKRVVKTGKLKFNLKKKYAKKTKLTFKIQNNDAHGLAAKKVIVRVK